MKRSVHLTAQFRRDFKSCLKQKLPVEALQAIMEGLRDGEKLSEDCRDHALKGNFSRFRECHILGRKSNWVLVYRYEGDEKIIFARTGSHDEVLSRV